MFFITVGSLRTELIITKKKYTRLEINLLLDKIYYLFIVAFDIYIYIIGFVSKKVLRAIRF